MNNDIIICCTPFTVNQHVARFCVAYGKAYFDLTEDNSKADWVKNAAMTYEGHADIEKNIHVMPQCGLAPGAVSIIAASMAEQFEEVDTIEIRVGALPINANNDMKYYMSWSPDGLINEYNHPCKARRDGELVLLQPLEGYETVVLDGVQYEAFNTSGGLGTLAESDKFSHVKNINYKTLRYVGHRDRMKFLFDDLNLRNNQQLLVDIFRQSVAFTEQDVVVIFIQITGMMNGRRIVKQYANKIYGDGMLTAIEKTTAGGVCAVVDWFVNTPDPKPTVLLNEMVPLDELQKNAFWIQAYGH